MQEQMGRRQSGALRRGIPSTNIDDNIAVARGQLEDFRPRGLSPKLDAGQVLGAVRVVFLPGGGPERCCLLIVAIDQKNIVAIGSAAGCQVCGSRALAGAALDAANDDYHGISLIQKWDRDSIELVLNRHRISLGWQVASC